jgi:hypothetical protein
MPQIKIINGDHVPNWPFVIVDAVGMHVDLSEVRGELWADNVARIEWGLVDAANGKTFGRVILKNGQGRKFFDPMLMQPYLAAYMTRWLEEKAKHETNVKKRAADKMKEMSKRATDEDMVRAAWRQVQQELGMK